MWYIHIWRNCWRKMDSDGTSLWCVTSYCASVMFHTASPQFKGSSNFGICPSLDLCSAVLLVTFQYSSNLGTAVESGGLFGWGLAALPVWRYDSSSSKGQWRALCCLALWSSFVCLPSHSFGTSWHLQVGSWPEELFRLPPVKDRNDGLLLAGQRVRNLSQCEELSKQII